MLIWNGQMYPNQVQFANFALVLGITILEKAEGHSME